MPKQHSPEFKSQVFFGIQNGLPIWNASQRYQATQSALYCWLRDAESAGGSPAPDYTTLQRKNKRLDHILQIIHLSGILEETPLQKRLTILFG